MEQIRELIGMYQEVQHELTLLRDDDELACVEYWPVQVAAEREAVCYVVDYFALRQKCVEVVRGHRVHSEQRGG